MCLHPAWRERRAELCRRVEEAKEHLRRSEGLIDQRRSALRNPASCPCRGAAWRRGSRRRRAAGPLRRSCSRTPWRVRQQCAYVALKGHGEPGQAGREAGSARSSRPSAEDSMHSPRQRSVARKRRVYQRAPRCWPIVRRCRWISPAAHLYTGRYESVQLFRPQRAAS
jgi:hypothetical protein